MSYVRAKIIKGHTYYYKVSSARDADGKVKQKVEKYYGKNPPQKSGTVDGDKPVLAP